MGLQSIGLIAKSGDAPSAEIVIRPGDSPSVMLTWKTLKGKDTLGYFDLAFSASTVSKTISETNGYKLVDGTFYRRVPTSEITATKVDDGYVWTHNMNVEGLLSAIAPNGWAFDSRVNDAIELSLGIKPLYTNGSVAAPRDSMTLHVYYAPNYSVTGLSKARDGIRVSYAASNNWARPDDSWDAASLSGDGSENVLSSAAGGSVDRLGRVTIPYVGMTEIPDWQNATVEISIHPSYMLGSGFELTATKPLVDATTCPQPTVTKTVDGDSVVLDIRASSPNQPEKAIVKLLGGEYDFDTMVVDVPSTVSMEFVPTNTDAVIQVVGITDDLMSEIVRVPVRVDGTNCIFNPLRGGAVYVRYDALPSWTATPAKKVVKFAGRKRSSAAYGIGGNVEGRLSGTFVSKDGTRLVSQTDSEFIDLAMAGDCVYRGADGTRKLVTIDSVSFSARSLTMTFVKDVTIAMTEVV